MKFEEIAVIIPAFDPVFQGRYLLPEVLESVKNAGKVYLVNNNPYKRRNIKYANQHGASVISPGINLHHALGMLIGMKHAFHGGFQYALIMHDDMVVTNQQMVCDLIDFMEESRAHYSTYPDHFKVVARKAKGSHPVNFGMWNLKALNAHPEIFQAPFKETEDSRHVFDGGLFYKNYIKPVQSLRYVMNRSKQFTECAIHYGSGTRHHETAWKYKFQGIYGYTNGQPGEQVQDILKAYRMLLDQFNP